MTSQQTNQAITPKSLGFRPYIPFILFLLSLYYIPKLEHIIGQENIHQFLQTAGIWAPVGFVALRVVTIVISPLLLGPLAVLANRAFGFWPAVGLNFAAVIIGSSINYWLGRLFGDKVLRFFFGKQFASLSEKYSHRYLTKSTVATAMLLYGYNFELVAYMCGIANVPYKTFMTALLASSVVSIPLMVWQDISIGKNNFLAVAINVGGYLTGIAAIWYVAGGDIKAYWKKLMAEIDEKTADPPKSKR